MRFEYYEDKTLIIGFSYRRYDGYFRLVINNYEYEGAINPDSFEYFEDGFRNDKFKALKELEAINGGKLTLVRKIETSKNEKILRGIKKLDR